ncbi:MAG: hypothetical protein ACK5YR_06265 [Pirellula sp.]|jgi:hypothetical protein
MTSPKTRPSLIIRIADPQDEVAWGEFVDIYEPILIRVGKSKGLQDVDARELAQDVLVTVLKSISTFSLSTTAQDSPDVAEGQGEINERRAHIDQLIDRLKSLSETDSDREPLKSELAQALMEEFTEMESTRRRQVEEMERRIEQLKNTLSLRSQNAEQIVAARISYLLGEASILDWAYRMPDDMLLNSEDGAEAEAEFLHAKEKLTREKMNRSQRASEYDELLRSMEERLRKLDELNAQLQNRKTEITMKEMRLLPLEREVERVHPSRGNRVGIEGAEKKR